ncbi:porin family protein [Bartonella kosoyi]|uniref:Porin n=1 Tax=Bartonella kosoyi TaxID=2133959 RepID=A0A5B9CWQ3_9HYPH|nr:outer membrane protein [Bartonella kosoyi]QEE08557.1 porin family protein [Bartonella kosoyi]
MNIKSLVTTSVIAMAAASAAQAADVIIPHEVAPVITAPSFSWTGFYIGGQIGGFSSKIDLKDKDKDTSVFKDLSPKLSGLIGGFYAGSNFDLGNGIILGVETDVIWSGKKDVRLATKTKTPPTGSETTQTGSETTQTKKLSAKNASDSEVVDVSEGVGFKQKWAGATRVRVGFAAADRIMPYVAGGVAYTQLEAAHGQVKVADKTFSASSSDETATMVGFTIGGGIDFAMTDNVLLRAEYRYSDYGKKKFFAKEKEYNFKTNDFRVGVAYKF